MRALLIACEVALAWSMLDVFCIIVLLVMVFGGFMLSGGALGPVMAAMPYEMLIIGGAAAGALVAGNSLDGLKALGTAMGKIFKGPKHDKQDHVDAIALTTQLMRMLKTELGPAQVVTTRPTTVCILRVD